MRKKISTFIFLFILQIGFCQNSKFEILVDEKMELITTVQYLSDYFLLTRADINYKKDIENYFGKYKDHPVIKLNKIIQKDYFNGSAVPWYLYQFSFPDFNPISNFTYSENQIEDYEKHKDTLDLFRKELIDFYQKSNFKKFYRKHKSFYKKLIKPIKEYIFRFDMISKMENHYGENKSKYKLILCPLMHDGGFGFEVNAEKGKEIFAFVGPKYNSVQIPNFDTNDILQQYIIHEFSHSFCNPVINKNFERLNNYNCLIDRIASQMKKQGYGENWETCLYEHLVRANEVVFVKQLFGNAESEKLYREYYNNRSWIYLEGLVPIIENDYLKNRTKYVTQNDLIDKIIFYFEIEKNKNCSK